MLLQALNLDAQSLAIILEVIPVSRLLQLSLDELLTLLLQFTDSYHIFEVQLLHLFLRTLEPLLPC